MSDDMQMNIAAFNKKISNFTNKLTPNQFRIMMKRLALEGLTRVVDRTKVVTGRARGNWQVTVNAPAVGDLDVTDMDGAPTKQQGEAIINQLRNNGIGEVIFLSNNVSYILTVEDIYGMVRLTLQDQQEEFS